MAHTRTHPTVHLWWLALALVVGGLVGYGFRLELGPTRTVIHEIRPHPISVDTLQYPLSIAAQRAKAYPGGDIKIEQDLGEQGGYRLNRVSYPSDGLRIYALMAIPSTPPPLFGYPAIILVHGYTNPATYRTNGPEYASYIAAFARRGYVVIKPDLRGHDRSWGTAPGAYYSTDYVTDILNLAGSLDRYSLVDGSSVGLFGHSMGGYIALEATTIQPRRFRAVSLLAPAAGDINDMYYHWQPHSEGDNPTAQAARRRIVDLFGDPAHNSEFWRTLSPLNYLADGQAAVQLHHGLADTVVPPRFTDEILASLQQQGRSAEVYKYPGIGHTPNGRTQGLVIERSLAFYDHFLHR